MIRLIHALLYAILYLIIGIPALGVEWIIAKFNKQAADLGQLRMVQWAVRVILLLIVVLVISISAALYYSSELGVSPYDAQALTLAEKTKFPFRAVRIGTDVVCCAVGFALGGDLGLATLVYAICMGQFIQFCREHLTDKMAAGELFHKLRMRIRENRLACRRIFCEHGVYLKSYFEKRCESRQHSIRCIFS